MATGYAGTFGRGRIAAGANDVVYLPRDGVGGRRAVVCCHGYLGSARVFLDDPPSPNMGAFARSLAAAGLVVVAVDMGDTWGDAAGVARVEAARAYAVTLGCAPVVNLFAVSMGSLNAWGYQRDHPGMVGAVCSVMPASDLADLRDNNRAGSQASIDAAWGHPLPAGANPTGNAALAPVPYATFYSSADTVVLPATVTRLADQLGGTATRISTTADHGDGLAAALQLGPVASFLAAHGS